MARATRTSYIGMGTEDSVISALATIASGKNPDGTDFTLPVGVSGSALTYFNAALLATKQAVKASAGSLSAYHIQNPNTVDAWVQFYDAALAGVTVGGTTPTLALWVPAGGALDTSLVESALFAAAITIAATTTATGSTAPSTGLVTNLLYN